MEVSRKLVMNRYYSIDWEFAILVTFRFKALEAIVPVDLFYIQQYISIA